MKRMNTTRRCRACGELVQGKPLWMPGELCAGCYRSLNKKKRPKEIDLSALLNEFFLGADELSEKSWGGEIPAEETAERVRALCASFLSKLDGGHS